MHIGYYSWKSKIRQKLCYFNSHPEDSVKPFLFDKVLHSEHEVTLSFANRKDVKTLICIREPLKSVQSIVSLYQRNDPSHILATEVGAAEYYIKRCQKLAEIGLMLDFRFTLYTAESLISDSAFVLKRLTSEIGLKTPLSNTFKTKKLTGVGGTGDNSGNLNNGKIVKLRSKYQTLGLSESKIDELNVVYNTTLAILKGN
jgi:hypothetical protein